MEKTFEIILLLQGCLLHYIFEYYAQVQWTKKSSFSQLFLRLYLTVVKMLLMGTNILLMCFLCLFKKKKNPNCAICDESNCFLYSSWCYFSNLVSFILYLQFLLILSDFYLILFIISGDVSDILGCWFGVGWLSGLFYFFSNFHQRLRTKLQNFVTVWWGEILDCLEQCWRVVTVFHCFLQKVQACIIL